MGFLFGGGAPKVQATSQPAAVGLQVQTSVAGLTIPLLYGQTRIPGNLIWYGDFVAIAHTSSSGGGGGGKGGGGGGGGSSTTYTYTTSVMIGLCAGLISGLGRIWSGKDLKTLAELGFIVGLGSTPQTPWPYLTTYHLDEAVGYPGLAYAAAANLDLGDSASLPSFNFEVTGKLSGAVSGKPDADPGAVILDMLTDALNGVGFPAAHLDTLATYSTYCKATGLLISPAWADQGTAADRITQIALLTNTAPVWSEGLLRMIPYGDTIVTGNGSTYTPPSAPLFDLTDADFLYADGDDPVKLQRKRAADAWNDIKLEYYDRANNYDPAIAESKDSAAIEKFGLLFDSTQEAHIFCDAAAAGMSAQLILQRQSVLNTYTFKLPVQWSILDPMDIVTITDSALGLTRQWVRLTEISEDEEGALSVTVEEYLQGSGAAPSYGRQGGLGYAADYNADPGNVAAPTIFEPPLALTGGGYELWAATYGPGSVWGGANVWASFDDATYRNIGKIPGPARMGTVLADTGLTIDVDISGSGGQLLSGSANDALTMQTLCYVGGEYLAYETATLIGNGQYRLGGLVRGAYDSTATLHLHGEKFVRIDAAVFKYALAQEAVGKPLYLKLPSVNVWGGGLQDLAAVSPYIYNPTGKPLLDNPPSVTGFTINTQGSLASLAWDAVQDLGRAISYRVRFSPALSGVVWSAATIVADNITGTNVSLPALNGTYLVKAFTTDYGTESASAASVTTTSAGVLNSNAVALLDEAAGGFAGVCSATQVAGGALWLASLDTLDDFTPLSKVTALAWGVNGFVAQGFYYFANALDLGAVYTSRCYANIAGYGLSRTNTLVNWPTLDSVASLAGAEAAQWGAQVEVRTTQTDPAGSPVWSAWMPLTISDYKARAFQFRLNMSALAAEVTPVVSGLSITVDMPDRVEGQNNVAVAAGGTHITFSPAFRATPAIGYGAQNLATGDVVIISGQSASGFDVQVKNSSGTGVARVMDFVERGYGYAT